MNLARYSSIILLVLFFFSNSVLAETSFTLQLPIIDYSETNSRVKDAENSEVSSKGSSLETSKLENGFISIGMESFVLYFYPFTESGYISGSYIFNDTFELGVDVGLNSSKLDNSENKSSSMLFGVFAGYFAPIFKEKVAGEYYLFLSQSNISEANTATVETNEEIQRSDSIESSIKLTADAVFSITKNVSYISGLGFSMSRERERESKNVTQISQIGIRVASIRVVFP